MTPRLKTPTGSTQTSPRHNPTNRNPKPQLRPNTLVSVGTPKTNKQTHSMPPRANWRAKHKPSPRQQRQKLMKVNWMVTSHRWQRFATIQLTNNNPTPAPRSPNVPNPPPNKTCMPKCYPTPDRRYDGARTPNSCSGGQTPSQSRPSPGNTTKAPLQEQPNGNTE